MAVLEDTVSTARTVSRAMSDVVDFWNGRADDVIGRFGCRSSVEAIELLFPTVRDLLSESKDFIVDNWDDIVRSSIRMNEVRLYLSLIKKFFGTLRMFEDEFCRNDYKAFSIFDDAWIARKYFVMMLEQTSLYNCVFIEFPDQGNSRAVQARPFRGMARAFADYFSGVTDVQLEDLIVNHKSFNSPVIWKGLRTEAVIFARFFGLRAMDMNHSFIIPGKHCPHRNLGLETDRPSRPDSEYGICAPMNLYKHCKI